MARHASGTLAAAWIAMFAVALVAGSIHIHKPRDTNAPLENFGSYIVTCTDTQITFLNFAAGQCKGAYSSMSSPLNQCGLEYFLPANRNFSWNALCNSTHMWYNNFPNDQCTAPSMLSRYYDTGACYDCPNKECKDANVAPQPIFGAFSDNAPWMENQWHTAAGNVFVSSMNAGAIFQGTYNADSDCVSATTCGLVHKPVIGGFKSASGLAFSKRVYALVTNDDAVQTNSLISFDPASPSNYTVELTAPDGLNLFGNLTLNGLAKHEFSDIFYATSLGNFSAGNGALYVIDLWNKKFITVASNLSAADGAYVFRSKLYISEVFSGNVHVYDVGQNPSSPTWLSTYKPQGILTLDDFFVTDVMGEERIFGADWESGNVASWAADGSGNTSIHASGLDHPTSVRPELEPTGEWKSDFVTVTAGGAYPAAGPGQRNGGGVFRLRLKNLPARIKSAGSVIQLTFSNSTCGAGSVTGASSSIDECLSNPVTGTSHKLSCDGLDIHRNSYTTADCTGTSTETKTLELICLPDATTGTGSISVCAKL